MCAELHVLRQVTDKMQMNTVILSVPIFYEEEDTTADTARKVSTPGSSIASYP